MRQAAENAGFFWATQKETAALLGNQAEKRLQSGALLRHAIDQSLVAFANRDHRDDDHFVVDLINQSVADRAQLDLVTIGQLV